ncbi:hypothetical protein [Vibrio mediterranei]|uniref:Peptidase S1 domain-containing protein n=1 Tax=Vibrio mediterranei TaxID=689 RepID=A0A3G4VIE1_9VIBR|nr:hypothetical protein [Vibrio mediterranei]AYV22721.1 hypothetical protein ECB94_16335 [Vibrio mediterranei]
MNNWWAFLIGFVTAFSHADSLEVLDEARIINQRLYLVHIGSQPSPIHTCFATQIANQTLITPAHCIYDYTSRSFYPLRDIRLTALFGQDERYDFAHATSVKTDHQNVEKMTARDDWAILEVGSQLGCHQDIAALVDTSTVQWENEPIQLLVYDQARAALAIETCFVDSSNLSNMTISQCSDMTQVFSGTPIYVQIGVNMALIGMVTNKQQDISHSVYSATSIGQVLTRLPTSSTCIKDAS